MFDAGMAADEATRLEMIGGADACPKERPFNSDEELTQRVLQYGIQRDRLQATVLHISFDVVLQVLADTRQALHDSDPVLPKMIRRSDPGEHQDLWRVDRAPRNNYLARRPHLGHPAALRILYTHGTAALEQDAHSQRPRPH